MRSSLALFLAAIACASPSDAASRNFGVTGFTRVRVDGPYRVTLATGVAPFASASGSAAALDRVAIDVEGSTLIVRPSRSSWGGYPGADVGPVEIRLGTHELDAAYLNGSGTLAIDKVRGLKFGLFVQGSGSAAIANTDVDQWTVAVAGTASAALGARTGKFNVNVRGNSTLDASTLKAKNAAVVAEGAATVRAEVSDTATVTGSGPATLAFAGSPACTVKMSSAATVTGCGPAQ
jgi:hypothetical protein